MTTHIDIDEARKSADPAMIPVLCRVVDRLVAQLEGMQNQRDKLAGALWSAEDQWGDDYLWEKWRLSQHLTQDLKDHLKKTGKA